MTRRREEWRNIQNTHYYSVSNLGRVRNNCTGVIRKPSINQYGYESINVAFIGRRRTRPVHTLVAEAFIGPRPKGMEVRHLDGNKKNNNIDNLVYGTTAENAQDKIRHGTSPRGERSPTARLTAEQVMDIRKRAFIGSRGKSNTRKLAQEYGVLPNTIYRIAIGKAWKHLLDENVSGRTD